MAHASSSSGRSNWALPCQSAHASSNESRTRSRRCSGVSTRNSPPNDQNACPPRFAAFSWSTSATDLPRVVSSWAATRPASPCPTTIASASTLRFPVPSPLRSCGELAETLRRYVRLREAGFGALVHERGDGGGKRRAKRFGFERADVRVGEPGEGLGGQVVLGPRLRGTHAVPQAREREPVVAHRVHVVLRLPYATAFDAGARVEGVDDAPTEDVLRDGRRGDEQASRAG